MPKRKAVDKEYQDLIKDIDMVALQESIRTFFQYFSDPRLERRKVYPAWYLILVILCAYLSGCNSISEVAHFAQIRNTWLNTLFGLQYTPPSYDTFWWFLVRVTPAAFKELISKWLSNISQPLNEQLLAVDGKRLRGVSDNEHINHLVELFATNSCLVLAQERVPDNFCERAALPELLKGIDVSGALISMDAHYAYLDALQVVRDAKADFLVGIKGNQGNLETEIKNYFDQAHDTSYEAEEFNCYQTLEKGHGRIEVRHVCVGQNLGWLPQAEQWGLKSLIEVRSERNIGDKVEQGVLYYGSSRAGTAEQFSRWVRGHWSIENKLHYVLDVVFDEDASPVDTGHAAENLALIRRLAMNVIKSTDSSRGMADARRCAMFEPNYLRGILARLFTKNVSPKDSI